MKKIALNISNESIDKYETLVIKVTKNYFTSLQEFVKFFFVFVGIFRKKEL